MSEQLLDNRPPLNAALPPQVRITSALLVTLLTAALLTLVLSLDLLPQPYRFHPGDVASEDIRAPRTITYVSQVQTDAARQSAADQVQPLQVIDTSAVLLQRGQQVSLLQAIGAIRADTSRRPAQKADAIQNVTQPPLTAPTASLLAQTDDASWTNISIEAQRLLQDVLSNRLTDAGAADMLQTLGLRVAPTFPETQRAAVVELTARFVRPNLVTDTAATSQAREDARAAVAPITVTYQRGQTVVRGGQVVGPVEIEALQQLGIGNPNLDWHSFGASALLSITLIAALAAYVWQFHRSLLLRDRRVMLVCGLLLLGAVAIKLVVPSRPLWAYVLPLPAISMLLSILLEARLGIAVGVVLATLLAWVAGGALDVATIAIVGATVGALGVWKRERLAQYFMAGAFVALAEVLAAGAFFLATRSDDYRTFGLTVFELAAAGVLSSLLAIGSFALLGRVFGILTTMQLLELADPTQPLLRRLLTEAPGTYHHSIMVGNLAERAAEVIGADPLLVRVAAYYHDIGKLERPWAFIENQADLGNVHDEMDPVESARVIAAHVTDGVAIAQHSGLPRRVRELIPQHHGTRMVSFFYDQAVRAGLNPDPADFTYAGPRPQSREAAILMLADSTEAAARASGEHSRESIERLVDKIIRERLEEGQFDECDLTLRDLTRIKQSFVTLLTGIYHLRIPYPPRTSRAAMPAANARRTGSDVPA